MNMPARLMGLLQRKGPAAADAVDHHASPAATPSISSPTTTPEPARAGVRSLAGEDKVIGPNSTVPDQVTSDPPAPSEEDGLAESGAHTEHEPRNRELEISPDDGRNDEKTVAGMANEENIDEEEKEDETVYPGGAALAVLTFGLCMATFVVALDNTIIGNGPQPFEQQTTTHHTNSITSNRHPPNHHRLQLSQRCGLVRLQLPPDNMLAPTILW